MKKRLTYIEDLNTGAGYVPYLSDYANTLTEIAPRPRVSQSIHFLYIL